MVMIREKECCWDKNAKVNILSLMVLQQVLILSLNFQVINTSLNPSTSHRLFLLLLELPPSGTPMCGKQSHGLRAEAVAEVGPQRQMREGGPRGATSCHRLEVGVGCEHRDWQKMGDFPDQKPLGSKIFFKRSKSWRRKG